MSSFLRSLEPNRLRVIEIAVWMLATASSVALAIGIHSVAYRPFHVSGPHDPLALPMQFVVAANDLSVGLPPLPIATTTTTIHATAPSS